MFCISKIPIKPIELSNQKPTEIKDCFVEIFENHLRYKMEFIAEEPINNEDYTMGWKEGVLNSYDISAAKNSISGIEKSFTADGKWGVYIMVSGFTNDIKCYFRTKDKAQQFFDKIYNWLYNGTTDHITD